MKTCKIPYELRLKQRLGRRAKTAFDQTTMQSRTYRYAKLLINAVPHVLDYDAGGKIAKERAINCLRVYLSCTAAEAEVLLEVARREFPLIGVVED